MLIKRLLALEGDWVTIPGRIEVEKIPKVFYRLCTPGHVMFAWLRARASRWKIAFQAMIAAQGHCWVEGDNPDMSTDSISKFGPVTLTACLTALLGITKCTRKTGMPCAVR